MQKSSAAKGVLYRITNDFVKLPKKEISDFAFVIRSNLFRLETLSGETPDFVIDWGDGTHNHSSTTRVHTYPYAGEWTITIKDYVSGWIIFNYIFEHNQILRILSPFPYSSTRTDFSHCFRNCASLTEIPTGLFTNNPNATNFLGCFNNCQSLTEIPAGLFTNNPNATNFGSCFSDCRSLTEIPAGLFTNNPNATNFTGCFSNCRSLTEIPAGLFANNPNANSFFQCFNTCQSLTEIPAGLFANNPNVSTFNGCFRNCQSLTEIPAGLFANNPNVINFDECFRNCQRLTDINISLHPSVLSKNVVYTNMFWVENSANSHQGYAPKLWESATTTHNNMSNCFTNNLDLLNWNEIPRAWR